MLAQQWQALGEEARKTMRVLLGDTVAICRESHDVNQRQRRFNVHILGRNLAESRRIRGPNRGKRIRGIVARRGREYRARADREFARRVMAQRGMHERCRQQEDAKIGITTHRPLSGEDCRMNGITHTTPSLGQRICRYSRTR